MPALDHGMMSNLSTDYVEGGLVAALRVAKADKRCGSCALYPGCGLMPQSEASIACSDWVQSATPRGSLGEDRGNP